MNNVLKLVSQTKVCAKCGIAKNLSEFRKTMGRNHNSVANKCEECFSEMRKATWAAKKLASEKLRAGIHVKTCNMCGFEKDFSEFNKDKTHLDGIKTYCRECDKTRNKVRRTRSFESPEARQEYLAKKNKFNRSVKYYDGYFSKRFGVTYEEVRAIYEAQLGRCANRRCGKEIVFYHENKNGRAHPGRACLDHDHNTGKVRELLCMSCNTILGTLETKENILLGLMEYRVKHKQLQP